MDCTPPAFSGLGYRSGVTTEKVRSRGRVRRLIRRGGGENADAVSQYLVPLAFLRKDRLRQFDGRWNSQSVPVLGSAENTILAEGMLLLVLHRAGVTESEGLRQAVRELVGEAEASAEVVEFVRSGSWRGMELIPLPVLSEPTVEWLIRNFLENFLLIAILPEAAMGTRQLVKFSFHWNNENDSNQVSLGQRALGYMPVRFEIKMLMPEQTASYHFEFQTPYELDCLSLEIPEQADSDDVIASRMQGGTWRDLSGNPVAHVHNSYEGTVTGAAVVELKLPRRGTRAVATTSIFTATMILALALFLPYARENLMSSDGSSATLLIAVPAAFIGFFVANSKESALVADLRRPLVRLMLASALTLLVMAGCIAGKLHEHLVFGVWVSCFALNVVMLMGAAYPLVKGPRQRKV